MKTLIAVLVTGMFLMTPALADDVADVKAAVLGLFDAVNAGDGEGRTAHRSPDYNWFGRSGALLRRVRSQEERKKAFQASVKAGRKRNYELRNMEVAVYGNTAVVTGYLVGTNTAPNGEVAQYMDRRTGVWVKQGGQWKEVHHHQSPIRIPQ